MKVIVNGQPVHVHWSYGEVENTPVTTCKIVKGRSSKEDAIEILAQATVKKHERDNHDVDKARKFSLDAALEQLYVKMEVPEPIIKVVNQGEIDKAKEYNRLVAKDRAPFWNAYFNRKPTFIEKIIARIKPKLRLDIIREIQTEAENEINA